MLHTLSVPQRPRPHADNPEIERLLELARTHLGMEVSWVSAFVDGQQFIHAASGDTAAMNIPVGSGTDLQGSFCTRVMSGTLSPTVNDSRRHLITRDLQVTRDLQIGSYIGVPWRGADGTPAGMLCCVSRSPNPSLDDSAVQLMNFVADVIGHHLSGPLALQRRAIDEAAAKVRAVLVQSAVNMVFQPVVRLSDGAPVGFEALARFNRDVFATPDRAFAAAAQAGLGVDLELMAARSAIARLPDVPSGAWLAVNLSAEALLSNTVQSLLLAQTGRRLCVELTEHTQVRDYRQLVAVTDRLRAAGLRLSVDDAGAGFASFSHILQLRPDVIKLDLSLVRDVDTDPVRTALARALVGFAADCGATLIAEGVETAGEYERLKELGVVYGQGYFFVRPGELP